MRLAARRPHVTRELIRGRIGFRRLKGNSKFGTTARSGRSRTASGHATSPHVRVKQGDTPIVGNRTILLMSSALALVLCATAPASAQVQKEGSGMPGGNATGGEGRAAKEQTGGEKSQKGTEPRGMTQGETKGQPGQSGKSTTQS